MNSKKEGFKEGFWSEKEIKETFLEEQRRYLWNEDYFGRVLVPLLNLRGDSVILDAGCGLGFLGQKLSECVTNGKVIGVDLDPKLIEAARARLAHSSSGTVYDFRVGDAYDLPVQSDCVDLAICQALLMHLDSPERAVAEMKRVTRKGGVVAAIEPNYARQFYFDTAVETLNQSVEDRTRVWRWNVIIDAGKKKLGRGDNEVGARMSYLFFKSGLRVKDVRAMDRAFWLVPPYEGHEVEIKHALIPPETYVEQLDLRNEFLVGGGTEEEWAEYFELMREIHRITQQQVEDKTYATTAITTVIITIAKKL